MEIGQVVADKYKLVRLLGKGGMGAVYEAHHTFIGRRVAFKVLKAELAGDRDIVSRFVREAQTATAIGSEHIVDVTDGGITEEGAPFIVMELLEGEDLADLIAHEAPLPLPRIAEIMGQVCRALHAAHERDIVHRDLKPANLFITRRDDGREWVKVLDFGIAKFRTLTRQSTFMTRTGMTMGTPMYMAPEQFRGARDVDRRADVYSAGVILYEMATGQTPFRASTYEDLIIKVATEDPEAPSILRPGLPPGFDAVVLKAMERMPADRFGSMPELAAALLPHLEAGAAAQSHAVPPTEPSWPRPEATGLPKTAPPPTRLATEPWTPLGVGPSTPAQLEPATLEPVPRRSMPRVGLVVAALVLVGLGGGVSAFFLIGVRDPAPPSRPDGPEPHHPAKTPLADIPRGPSSQEVKDRARQLIEQEGFEPALAVLDSLGPTDDPEVEELRRLAGGELAARRFWKTACLELERDDLEGIYQTCKRIEPESRYHRRGCCEAAADRLGERRLEEADHLLGERQYDEAAQRAMAVADDLEIAEPIRERARQLHDRARREAEREASRRPEPTPGNPRAPEKRPPVEPSPRPDRSSPAEHENAVQEARRAYVNHDYSTCIRVLRGAPMDRAVAGVLIGCYSASGNLGAACRIAAAHRASSANISQFYESRCR